MFAARAVAYTANKLLTVLRNYENLRLTREEFRQTKISFSSFGEDLAVIRWLYQFPNIPKIYVDAGCNDPIINSNTLLLHKHGWRGVNIDMSSEHIDAFNRLRPDDINVVAALGSSTKEMKLFGYGNSPTGHDRLGEMSAYNLPSLDGEVPVRERVVATT